MRRDCGVVLEDVVDGVPVQRKPWVLAGLVGFELLAVQRGVRRDGRCGDHRGIAGMAFGGAASTEPASTAPRAP